jgi:hypothetical protein
MFGQRMSTKRNALAWFFPVHEEAFTSPLAPDELRDYLSARAVRSASQFHRAPLFGTVSASRFHLQERDFWAGMNPMAEGRFSAEGSGSRVRLRIRAPYAFLAFPFAGFGVLAFVSTFAFAGTIAGGGLVPVALTLAMALLLTVASFGGIRFSTRKAGKTALLFREILRASADPSGPYRSAPARKEEQEAATAPVERRRGDIFDPSEL